MNLTDVTTLIDYNCWATGCVLDAAALVSPEQFTASSNPHSASPREMLVHILSAERLWRTRFETGISSVTIRAENIPTVGALRKQWQAEEEAMRAYLSTLNDAMLTDPVQFRRLSGEMSESFTRWNLLVQIIIHGTQHRSETALPLTVIGHSPGDLDFLFFLLRHR